MIKIIDISSFDILPRFQEKMRGKKKVSVRLPHYKRVSQRHKSLVDSVKLMCDVVQVESHTNINARKAFMKHMACNNPNKIDGVLRKLKCQYVVVDERMEAYIKLNDIPYKQTLITEDFVSEMLSFRKL